jgi:hypothetical protein
LTPTGRLEKQTHAPQQNGTSFDHLVGANQEGRFLPTHGARLAFMAEKFSREPSRPIFQFSSR